MKINPDDHIIDFVNRVLGTDGATALRILCSNASRQAVSEFTFHILQCAEKDNPNSVAPKNDRVVIEIESAERRISI